MKENVPGLDQSEEISNVDVAADNDLKVVLQFPISRFPKNLKCNFCVFHMSGIASSLT